MPVVQLNVAEQMVGGVAGGRPFGKLFFRVGDVVRAVAKQKLFLNVPIRARDNGFCAKLFEKRNCLQRILKAAADGNIADVIIPNAERAQKFQSCAVADLRVGHKRHALVDTLLVPVDRHDLMAETVQLHGKMASEASQSDQQNVLHILSSFKKTITRW